MLIQAWKLVSVNRDSEVRAKAISAPSSSAVPWLPTVHWHFHLTSGCLRCVPVTSPFLSRHVRFRAFVCFCDAPTDHRDGFLSEHKHLDRAQLLGGLLKRNVLYVDGQDCIIGVLRIHLLWCNESISQYTGIRFLVTRARKATHLACTSFRIGFSTTPTGFKVPELRPHIGMDS